MIQTEGRRGFSVAVSAAVGSRCAGLARRAPWLVSVGFSGRAFSPDFLGVAVGAFLLRRARRNGLARIYEVPPSAELREQRLSFADVRHSVVIGAKADVVLTSADDRVCPICDVRVSRKPLLLE